MPCGRHHHATSLALSAIQSGALAPTFVINHRLPLDAAANGYDMFLARSRRLHEIVAKL